jgi:hypothetical protein
MYATFLIRVCRLETLKSSLQKKKMRCKKKLSLAEAEMFCQNINKSQQYCLFRVACLERTLAIFLLAISSGKSVDMVVGVQLSPFESHAWIEASGVPVQEEQAIETYKKILVV